MTDQRDTFYGAWEAKAGWPQHGSEVPTYEFLSYTNTHPHPIHTKARHGRTCPHSQYQPHNEFKANVGYVRFCLKIKSKGQRKEGGRETELAIGPP